MNSLVDSKSERCVLVVEDDEALALLVRVLLNNAGYSVETVGTGWEAIACVERDHVDLVLLDLMLPDMNGLDICRRLRARGDGVYLPIIMVTALGGDAQRVAGFGAGADDYVTKPFNGEELVSRVRVWWETRQRLVANQQQLAAQARALHEAERRELTAQVEAIKMAARELTDLVNNRLAMAKGTLELLQTDADLPPELQPMVAQAEQRLAEVAGFIQRLERVVRLEVKTTPTGPALDLARSTQARGRTTPRAVRELAERVDRPD
ncbi:MAG TPA: response regulator [Chloroflexota bacterium]|jgi:DNA-binding response OmpR family regulator